MNQPKEQPLPLAIIELARLFHKAGVRLYGVGGMTRNPLLGYAISDIDVCSSMRPELVQSLCNVSGLRVIPKGIDYGTVQIMLEDPLCGSISVEHTTFRGDIYGIGGSHRPVCVEFSDTPEQDAFRRDFTVNALYLDLLDNVILDPAGGMTDIQKKQIRATSKEPREIMRSDGLRILRMVRFAAELGFTIEEKTLEAAKDCVDGLRELSFERIRDELNKILLADVRYAKSPEAHPKAVLEALLTLESIGAYDIILPELAKGRGVFQDSNYHAFDVFNHALHACSHAPALLHLRLAALFHDIGKPYAIEQNGFSLQEDRERMKGPSPMQGHDKLGEAITRKVLTRLRYSNEMIGSVALLVLFHMYDLDARAKENTLRTRFTQWGENFTESLSYIREADVHGSGLWMGPVKSAVRWRQILSKMKEQNAPFSERELQCSGDDIMRWLCIGPSSKVGDIKKKLLEHCARFPKDNSPERLERIARGMAH